MELTVARGKLGPLISCLVFSGLDIDPYDEKTLPFGRPSTRFRKPASSAARPVSMTTAGPIPMTEAEPHNRKTTPGAQWQACSFDATPRSVREARRFVGSVVTQPAMREAGELLVSELTTNALRHAAGPFEVRVRAEPSVRVEVRDGSTRLPTVKDIDPFQESGRGLQIVGEVARAWGTEECADGKVVWFEL